MESIFAVFSPRARARVKTPEIVVTQKESSQRVLMEKSTLARKMGHFTARHDCARMKSIQRNV
jgi:hypothetical protein